MNVNNLKKYILVICLWIISQPLKAYVHSLTSSGAQIRWPTATSIVEIYFNPTNSHGIDTTNLQTIAGNSVSQWNNVANISIRLGTTAGTNQAGVNEIYFSNEPTIFNGSGVVGITNSTYTNDTDGTILAADILIRDTDFDVNGVTHYLDTNILSEYYVGNVITHELGHFLGLNHSQVVGSTMFYAISLGQSQLADDDKSGLYSIYPSGDASKKSISGTVIGSKNLYGVFGVNVQAISQKTGKVVGADITGVDGRFSISGLPIDDKYFLYNSFLTHANEPTFYGTSKSNFCDTGTDYRGSFFQACGGSNEGFPQAISLINSNVDVGKVTIRCSLDVPPDYMQKKAGGALFNLIPNIDNGVGNSFVGFFSNAEISNSAHDLFNIDLSYVTPTQWSNLSSSNLYLEIQVINQNFYSPFKANVAVIQNSTTTNMPSKYIQNPSDGEIDINTTTRIAIDKVTPSNNIFEIKITPESMKGAAVPSGIPFTKDQIFPAYNIFEDNLFFYLVNSHIVVSNGDGTYTQVSSRTYQVSDNSNCPDASGTYQLTSFTTGTNQSASKKSSPLSCGTIEIDNNDHDNHSGPLGLLVGFFFIGLLFKFKKKTHFI